MKTIEKRTNVGYEIELYYPKEKGMYTSKTGNTKEVIQCENVGEVAQWFARESWSRAYEDSDIACPTVWYNGMRWCFNDYSEVK